MQDKWIYRVSAEIGRRRRWRCILWGALMQREILLLGVMAILSILVVAKGDKQITHLLEGKLFKDGRDVSKAKAAYTNNKKSSSLALFIMGFISIGLSIIFLVNEFYLLPLAVMASLLFTGMGIWGRISSFRAAERELDRSSLSDQTSRRKE
jgi:hypothetical protein